MSKDFSAFGAAPIKRQGQPVYPDIGGKDQEIETTYVERRVPVHLKDEAHKLIDDWLIQKGFDPEEM